MSWSTEADRLKMEQAKQPDGCQSITEIAKELSCSEDHAKDLVTTLIKQGRAESVKGKKLTAHNSLVPCLYYRLIGDKKVVKNK